MKPIETIDDPRLTAWVLGELEGEEQDAVQAFVAGSDEARRAADEIRAAADALRAELAGTTAPSLTDAQKQAIENELTAGPRRGRVSIWLRPALAAAILLTLVWGLYGPGSSDLLLHQEDRAPEGPLVAQGEPADKYEDKNGATGFAAPRSKGSPYGLSFASEAGSSSEDQRLRDSLAKGDERLEAARRDGKPEATPSAQSDTRAASSAGAVASGAQVSAGEAEFFRKLGYLRDNDPDGDVVAEESAPPEATIAMGEKATGAAGGATSARGETRRRKALGQGEGASRSYKMLVQKNASGSIGNLTGRGRVRDSVELAELQQLGYTSGSGPQGAHGPSTPAATVAGIPAERDDSQRWYRQTGAESYEPLADQPFRSALRDPLSTFSIDVDTGAYANVRRFLNGGQLPPRDAVRIEEMINYFSYDYAPPGEEAEAPFAVHLEAAACPWTPEHRLVRIGLKGREVATEGRPRANLVFLLDVSGSMNSPDKLPLLKAGMKLLVKTLRADDSVAIVTYAGRAATVLQPTSCADKARILDALDALRSGGSTNGEGGLQMAYACAEQAFVEDGVNRVMLCTDGDFNVGVTGRDELERVIAEKAKGGVFLTVLGFGTGNLKDSTVEMLADRGNGHYAYIDSLSEARKVLVEEAGSTLVTIAKDVKIQVEFNPGKVAAYRLIGYVNRALAARDFNDDKKDAGEIGAGHTVTALYEVVPAGVAWQAGVDPLKYQQPPAEEVTVELVESDEWMTIKLRFKAPDGETSEKIERTLAGEEMGADETSPDFRFAAAVARFGMLLRDPGAAAADLDAVVKLAETGRGADPRGYRAEFLRLVRIAQDLMVR